MSRLLFFAIGFLSFAQPAFAQVCDKVLADWGGGGLLNAPFWRYLSASLLSPVPLGLIALAVLVATRVPRLRGIALIAGIVATAKAASAIADNIFPDQVIALARLEGCGGVYPANAVAFSLLALILLGSFLIARTDPAEPGA